MMGSASLMPSSLSRVASGRGAVMTPAAAFLLPGVHTRHWLGASADRLASPRRGPGIISGLIFICSGDGRLIDSLNGGSQRSVELGIGLMDRQPFQQGPREARHHPVSIA